ncbi:hypothetical protein NDU88_009595 [Pleurodeles waltl]|uniref:Uncharacterized protein n=1 Tax=Pleurodeles waltl TaxID=8319 RepID=A0AAV7RY29_PLEWA|nr:hypothetical protein NDU88_009595 [Pleurodeles waltl]
MVFGGLTLVLSLFPCFHCHLSDLREVGRSGSPAPGSDPILSRGWTSLAHAGPHRGRKPPAASGGGPPVGAAVSRCAVSLCAPSALDFRTTGLRTFIRYVPAAAPRLSLSVAVGVAALPLIQFELSCCRDRVSGSENFVISTMWGLVPHTAAILVFWSSGARSYFLLSYLIGGVATAPGSARGSANVGIAFDLVIWAYLWLGFVPGPVLGPGEPLYTCNFIGCWPLPDHLYC